MMIHQTTTMNNQTNTMNNLMMMLAAKEVRREEVPISITHQQPSPNSTITNSQHTLSQQSTNANKRIRMGRTADDETTAASTIMQGQEQTDYGEEDDIDKMLEDHDEAMQELAIEQRNNNKNDESINVTMINDEQTETGQQLQSTTTNNKITTALAAGNFEHQFSTSSKSADIPNNSETPSGVNPNRQ
jgi:hypothetical protein